MDYKKIEKKYLKVFELISSKEGWPKGNECYKYFANLKMGIPESEIMFDWEDRNLYDFFDKQGIYGRIKTPFEHATYSTTSFLFGWFIQSPINKSMKWDSKYMYEYHEETNKYKSRSMAEKAAFERAFEILENKLN